MFLESILLGIIQGIIEWLPISSQGNLVLFMIYLLGFNEEYALNLAVYLHIGTLFAVIFYFNKEIINILKSLKYNRGGKMEKKEKKVFQFLFFSTLITGLVGYPIFYFGKIISGFGNIFIALIGLALLLTGLFQKKLVGLGTRKTYDVTFFDSIILGLVQGLSAFPGISRSGITTANLLFRNFKMKDALKLSFLMSIPAILIAEIGLGLLNGFNDIIVVDLFFGCLSSFFIGLMSIHYLLKLVEKINFGFFCVVLGLLTLLQLII